MGMSRSVWSKKLSDYQGGSECWLRTIRGRKSQSSVSTGAGARRHMLPDLKPLANESGLFGPGWVVPMGYSGTLEQKTVACIAQLGSVPDANQESAAAIESGC